ncbi:MAG: hypothetical protein ACYC25_08020, partial [Paludibacter sp.]
MKIKITPVQLQNISKIGLFLCLIAIIAELFPTENTFKYQFEIGKPWSYDLMTASFDFPIYKSEEQIGKERDDLLKDFTPYFQMDTATSNRQINKLFSDEKIKTGKLPAFRNYLKSKFKSIYSVGIISVEDYNNLLETNRKNISVILPNRMTHNV